MSEEDAISWFQKCEAILAQRRHLSLSAVAVRLDCSPQWVRTHLSEFPNAWRMPGGEIRIPLKDVEALARARRFLRNQEPVETGA